MTLVNDQAPVNDRFIPSVDRYLRLGLAVARERGIFYVVKYEISSDVDALLTQANHVCSFLYARVLDKPLIHVIGDSHSWAFKRNRSFIVHNIGPATAYNLNKTNSTVRSNEKLFDVIRGINKKKDVVILVFGEIDCRVHFFNQYKKSKEKVSIDELMDKTISNYGDVLGQLSDAGVNFIVYGILPAAKHIIRYPVYTTEGMKKELSDEFKNNYPYRATPEMRCTINKKFNMRLKSYCFDHGYKFIDIYPVVADKDGFISDAFTADEIHVNGRIMPFIKESLGKYDIKL
jgi:hypothetical protein